MLLPIKCCVTLCLRGMLHFAISLATNCIATNSETSCIVVTALTFELTFDRVFCSARNVYLDVPQKGDEADEQHASSEQEKMNVTMNPLEKFETAEDEAGSQGTTNQKTLEWDDAYIA